LNIPNENGHSAAYVVPSPPTENVAYTICESVGIDHHRWLTHREDRLVQILDPGELVRELFT